MDPSHDSTTVSTESTAIPTLDDSSPPDQSISFSAYYRPNLQLHIAFFTICFLVMLMSFLMSSEGQSSVFMPGMSVPMPETCSTKSMFGMNCPGCGLTRAFISISRGDFARAWHFNPGSFGMYLFFASQIPWNAYQIFRIKRGIVPLQSNWFFAVPVIAVAGIVMQWLFRTFA